MDSLTQNTLNQENAIKNFLRDYLNAAKDGQTVNSIISRTCGYYDADRVCVSEINPQRTEISVTYEHNRDGISPLSEELWHFSVRDAESCLKMLEEKGEFYIASLNEHFGGDTEMLQKLFPQDVSSIAVAPLVVNGTIVGCLRLDNPRSHCDYLLLLSIIASACCTEIANKRLQDTNKALIERMKIIQSMSEIYTSVYYIDLADNSFVEITSLYNVHNQIGASGIAQERLDYFCKNMMTEEYTNELLDFVNLKTLGERLSGEKIISREFLCTVPRDDILLESPYWAQCSFIEVDRDKGQLAHVVFATQTIHEFKTKELNTTKKLQETNTELSELLEAEKKHTAIIYSLSSVFFSLYYINVEENTFQGIFSRDGLTKTLGEKDNASLFMKSAVDTWVNDEFKDEMRIFTDIATVDERLGDKRIISTEYEDITGKWVRCSIISAEKNEFGRNVGLICGFRDITAERERRETLSNLIQALALSYQNVYAVNMDTNEAVCYRMNSTIKSRYGQEFAVGDYELNIKMYVENDVYADDRRLFDKISTIAGVRKLLEGKTTHSFGYRVFRDGKISYFECQVVKPNDKRNEFAVGFKNVDEEKKQEIAQQKRIEEAFDAAEKANKKLRYEMAIAGTLSKDYPDVVLLDLANDTATTIKRHGVIIEEDNRVQRRSYNKTWDNYVEKYVIEEDSEALKAAVSIPSVQSALRNSDEYVCSYRVVYDDTGVHYFQALFIRMFSAFSALSEDSQIILGFRNVDAIVEEERKNIKIQEEQLNIIGALSQEYHSLFKIEADTGEISLYRTDGVGMPPELMGKLMESSDYTSVLAKYIESFIVPEDRERIREATTLEVLAERVPEKGLYKLGYRRNLNGVISYFEMNVVKIADWSGHVTYIMGLRDVNDEMQRQLKQAREFEAQSEIIEGLGSVYYSVLLVYPETDKVVTYRAAGEDGRAIAEYFRRHDHCWSKGIERYSEEHISENSRAEFMEKLSLDYIRTHGEDYSLTYERNTPSGAVYLQARISYVREKNGGFVTVVGTRNVDDIVKKERLQEAALQAAFDAAEAANKAKTDFLSNMSHDIRTPMNGIIGMTAIAATHIDDKERVQDCLQKISQASKHMLSLINEVLDMSKIESGKVDLIEEEFNLSNLVDNLLTMTSSQINAHGHKLSVNISGVTHEEVIGDSLRIQKVFTNLMSNAVKYTPDGGEIRFSITERPSGQAKVGCYEFIFEDNGIGMSEDFMDRIFEPFARASDSRVNKIQGTGLGMPISRNIVRMMGGDIKVESELNKGTRFTVTIYLKLQDTVEIHEEKFIDLNVLVADDDEMSLDSCCTILEDFGMKPDGVSSGEQAVKQVVKRHEEKRDYFACIIDWKMPEMDGIATTRAIRKAVGNDVPIIIISAYDWSDIEPEARAAGANAFISKPLFRSRLAKTFNTLVGVEEKTEQAAPLVALNELNLSGKRVLVAEDNDLNAEIAEEILEMTGIEVERACDGAEAVDMVSAREDGYYDLIFMDIQMPHMNGYDATRAIRAMDRNYCKQVPIVAMTANAFAEDVQAAKTIGMNEHIAKPLDLNALAATLQRWLK